MSAQTKRALYMVTPSSTELESHQEHGPPPRSDFSSPLLPRASRDSKSHLSPLHLVPLGALPWYIRSPRPAPFPASQGPVPVASTAHPSPGPKTQEMRLPASNPSFTKRGHSGPKRSWDDAHPAPNSPRSWFPAGRPLRGRQRLRGARMLPHTHPPTTFYSQWAPAPHPHLTEAPRTGPQAP